jgi:DnaJ family protein C protein 28
MKDKWQSYIDRALENIGDDQELTGKGKPLNLSQDSTVPDEFRSAFKIMRENDIAPEWIMLGKELNTLHDNLMKQIKTQHASYKNALANASTEQSRALIERNWGVQKQKLQTAVDRYNDKSITYNLKVPTGIPHRHLIRFNVLLDSLG